MAAWDSDTGGARRGDLDPARSRWVAAVPDAQPRLRVPSESSIGWAAPVGIDPAVCSSQPGESQRQPVASIGSAALSEAEARRLADEVKRHMASAWQLLWRLFEGEAHTALGYKSWHAFCAAEFGFQKSQSYRIRDAGRVLDAVPQLGNEAQARELVPLLRDHPEALDPIFREATLRAGASNRPITAAMLRGIVKEFRSARSPAEVVAADLIAPLSPSAQRARRLVEVVHEIEGRLAEVEEGAARFAGVETERELGDAWSAQTALLSLLRDLGREARSLLDQTLKDARGVEQRTKENAQVAGVRLAEAAASEEESPG